MIIGSPAAIIGSAGRGDEALKFTSSALFDRMVDRVEKVLTEELKLPLPFHFLSSGGSAWSDHVAVALFLAGKARNLLLELPCKWDKAKSCFDCKSEEGQRLNQLHRSFSRVRGVDSLAEIQAASKLPGFMCQVRRGFLRRNDALAKECMYLVALGWSETGKPESGGTLYTWNKFKGSPSRRVFISLCSLGNVSVST